MNDPDDPLYQARVTNPHRRSSAEYVDRDHKPLLPDETIERRLAADAFELIFASLLGELGLRSSLISGETKISPGTQADSILEARFTLGPMAV